MPPHVFPNTTTSNHPLATVPGLQQLSFEKVLPVVGPVLKRYVLPLASAAFLIQDAGLDGIGNLLGTAIIPALPPGNIGGSPIDHFDDWQIVSISISGKVYSIVFPGAVEMLAIFARTVMTRMITLGRNAGFSPNVK